MRIQIPDRTPVLGPGGGCGTINISIDPYFVDSELSEGDIAR